MNATARNGHVEFLGDLCYIWVQADHVPFAAKSRGMLGGSRVASGYRTTGKGYCTTR